MCVFKLNSIDFVERFNYLNKTLPQYEDSLPKKLIRNAGIGFTASIASDTISNSVRVIKTSKQFDFEFKIKNAIDLLI